VTSEFERNLQVGDLGDGRPLIDVNLLRWAPPLIGEVRAPNGQIMEPHFELTVDQVLDGVAWMRCPDCLGDPRGYQLPDDRFERCVRCRGRHVVPVSV
jgi:hypothetical protein